MGKTPSYIRYEKEVIERAAELARENARRLQQPMPHTIRKRKAQEKKGRK